MSHFYENGSKIPTETSDYRLISELPIVSKIFGRVFLQEMINVFVNNVIYHQKIPLNIDDCT